MHISPSTRLLIHILVVLCLSYRLVLSQDTGLVDDVMDANAAEVDGNQKTAEPTESTTESDSSTTESLFSTTELDMNTTESEMNTTESIVSTSSFPGTEPTESTTESDSSTTESLFSTTEGDMNTTESEMNTTESIVSTSSFPGNLSCVLANKVCVLEGTEDLCDPCDGINCDADKYCLSDNSTCTTKCDCTDEKKIENKEGVCIDPCNPTPCQNKQPCKSILTVPSKFQCQCSPDYDGEFCQNEHNYCNDAKPAKCPIGAFDCVMKGVGQYDCKCADGHNLDEKTNTCIKVTQRLSVDLIFTQTYYSEAYNVEGTEERKNATDSIHSAMADLYGSLLISISYDNFTQGSLVAHYKMDMRMAANGDPDQNIYDLMKYTINCETDNAAKKACFGDLGKPHLPINGTVTEDLRCNDVFCPVGTQCVPIPKSENSVRCSCADGYKYVKTVVEETGRQVDVCEDIDQCTLDKPCKEGEICINKPGTFECKGSPCDKKPCPGNAQCKAIDQYAYDCQCDWIYIASDCGTPWPLILVIVSSVLLALLILAIIGLIILFSRSKKGSYSIFTTKESVSPYDRYGSSSDRN